MLTAKSKRCYHRVMSGLERGGEIRFITLTSSPQSPSGLPGIQRSWRRLSMRLSRRGLMRGYVRVPEIGKETGMVHLHVIFRGSYIEQALLSKWWSDIHQAPVVDIRRARGKKGVASYMAKYMSKENAGHYSWSWGWVWRGFVRDWTIYKRWWWRNVYIEGKNDFGNLLIGWRMLLQGLLRFDFSAMQDDFPIRLCLSIDTHGIIST